MVMKLSSCGGVDVCRDAGSGWAARNPAINAAYYKDAAHSCTICALLAAYSHSSAGLVGFKQKDEVRRSPTIAAPHH
jgi:hypothetical protein